MLFLNYTGGQPLSTRPIQAILRKALNLFSCQAFVVRCFVFCELDLKKPIAMEKNKTRKHTLWLRGYRFSLWRCNAWTPKRMPLVVNADKSENGQFYHSRKNPCQLLCKACFPTEMPPQTAPVTAPRGGEWWRSAAKKYLDSYKKKIPHSPFSPH